MTDQTTQDHLWMAKALELAREASQLGEVPVGAVVVQENQIVGEGFNRRETQASPLAHAEMLALQQAAEGLGRWRLSDCTLYVTLEPCPMCAGAIWASRLERVVYATADPKAGAVHSLYQILSDSRLNHRVPVTTGIYQHEASQLLKVFFRGKRG